MIVKTSPIVRLHLYSVRSSALRGGPGSGSAATLSGPWPHVLSAAAPPATGWNWGHRAYCFYILQESVSDHLMAWVDCPHFDTNNSEETEVKINEWVLRIEYIQKVDKWCNDVSILSEGYPLFCFCYLHFPSIGDVWFNVGAWVVLRPGAAAGEAAALHGPGRDGEVDRGWGCRGGCTLVHF